MSRDITGRRMGDSNFCISADNRGRNPANTGPTGTFTGRRPRETTCSDMENMENMENCATYCATQNRALHVSFLTGLWRLVGLWISAGREYSSGCSWRTRAGIVNERAKRASRSSIGTRFSGLRRHARRGTGLRTSVAVFGLIVSKCQQLFGGLSGPHSPHTTSDMFALWWIEFQRDGPVDATRSFASRGAATAARLQCLTNSLAILIRRWTVAI